MRLFHRTPKLKLNKRLLKKIKKAIIAEPEHFDMEDWFYGTLRDNEGGLVGVLDAAATKGITIGCGTTACLAGWAVALSKSGRVKKAREDAPRTDTAGVAMLLIGLSEEETPDAAWVSHPLFHHKYWPKHYYGRHGDDLDTRAEAIEILDSLIAGRMPEWRDID